MTAVCMYGLRGGSTVLGPVLGECTVWYTGEPIRTWVGWGEVQGGITGDFLSEG